MPLLVNGVEISEERIREEMQYHPASSIEDARRQAREALIVRTLLLGQAKRTGIDDPPPLSDATNKLVEAPEEAMIRALIESEVIVPEPDEAECRDYYEKNPKSFMSPDLMQAAHILFAANPNDAEAMADAKERAEGALVQLQEAPNQFPKLAHDLSDCSSAKNGGDLGHITPGSTVPEFETFLFALEPGQICPVPVRTRYGYHIVRLDQRLKGRQLPYESVKAKIRAYLRELRWRDAVRDYIGRLMAAAVIEDIDPISETSNGACGAGCGCGSSTGVPHGYAGV